MKLEVRRKENYSMSDLIKFTANIPVWNIRMLGSNEEDEIYWFEITTDTDHTYYISKEDFIRVEKAISHIEGIE